MARTEELDRQKQNADKNGLMEQVDQQRVLPHSLQDSSKEVVGAALQAVTSPAAGVQHVPDEDPQQDATQHGDEWSVVNSGSRRGRKPLQPGDVERGSADQSAEADQNRGERQVQPPEAK